MVKLLSEILAKEFPQPNGLITVSRQGIIIRIEGESFDDVTRRFEILKQGKGINKRLVMPGEIALVAENVFRELPYFFTEEYNGNNNVVVFNPANECSPEMEAYRGQVIAVPNQVHPRVEIYTGQSYIATLDLKQRNRYFAYIKAVAELFRHKAFMYIALEKGP